MGYREKYMRYPGEGNKYRYIKIACPAQSVFG